MFLCINCRQDGSTVNKGINGDSNAYTHFR
jgi:hypothetical protein